MLPTTALSGPPTRTLALGEIAHRETNGACPVRSRGVKPAPRWQRPALTNLHAPLCKILDRAGMEGNRRSRGFLVLQPEILRLLVHGDHVVTLVEDGLDDVVRGLVAQVLMRNEDVPHRGLAIV